MTAGDRPRRPRVSAQDEALWHAVTQSVTPLKRSRRTKKNEAAAATSSPAEPAKSPAIRPRAPTPAKPRPSSPKSPALAVLDRRARQRLARGTQAIDARLDLHGRTVEQAHAVLVRFLHRAQADGAKTVLVITGKGGGDGGRGVLRQQVPQWLALPDFRPLVVGFGEAAIAHGGQGALYVRVRRAR